MISLLDILVAAGLLALALRTATARDDRSAVVAFVALGLLLALAWVRLASIDVALTEAAIGSGATGFLLLGAEKHLRGLAGTPALPRRSVRIVVGLFCAVIATGLSAAVLLAPDPAPTLAPQAVANMGVTGLGNAVTAVLLGYRSLDTLVEAIVLLLALLGVWSLAPIEAWGGAAQLRADDPPAPLVFLARTLPPIGVMFGIYLFWEGANAPGGAFQGGTVLAAMWILRDAGRAGRCPIHGQPHVARAAPGWPGGLPCRRICRVCLGRQLPRLSRELGEDPDPVDRGCTHAVHRGDAGLARGRSAPARKADMMAAVLAPASLFGLCGAAMIGIGLYVVALHPALLRKALGFNLVGAGIFLLFGSAARRGAAAGLAGDPVPQAMVITGVVVAFSATALAIALMRRLADVTGRASVEADETTERQEPS